MFPKNAERKKHNRQDRLPSEVTRKYDSPMNTHPGETAQSRTVAKLKHRLRSGQFTNAMPGERELSKALAAGRGTIRKALAQLQEEGFIAAPDKNRARKIIRTSTSPVQPLPLLEKRVCFLSSVPIRDIPQSIWVELYQLEKALRIEGMALQLVEAEKHPLPGPGSFLPFLQSAVSGYALGSAGRSRGRLPVPERTPSDRALHTGFQAERQQAHGTGVPLLPGGTLYPLCHPHAVGCH